MKKTILFCVALAGLTAMSSCGNKAATKLEMRQIAQAMLWVFLMAPVLEKP